MDGRDRGSGSPFETGFRAGQQAIRQPSPAQPRTPALPPRVPSPRASIRTPRHAAAAASSCRRSALPCPCCRATGRDASSWASRMSPAHAGEEEIPVVVGMGNSSTGRIPKLDHRSVIDVNRLKNDSCCCRGGVRVRKFPNLRERNQQREIPPVRSRSALRADDSEVLVPPTITTLEVDHGEAEPPPPAAAANAAGEGAYAGAYTAAAGEFSVR